MSPMPSPPLRTRDSLRIEICKDAEDLARHGAQAFIDFAGRALGARGQFRVALSGGQTPRNMYAALAQEHLAFQVVWQAAQIFFSDERCVPPDDERSNYHMAHETLLSKIAIADSNIHRMCGEEGEPESAARAYEKSLREQFHPEDVRFDLVMLGMGGDGHTASLFPEDPALRETDRLVTVVHPAEGPPRLTLTLPVINAARAVMILVSGEAKAEMIQHVLGGANNAAAPPIKLVRPSKGEILWLLDAGAASLLPLPEESQKTE